MKTPKREWKGSRDISLADAAIVATDVRARWHQCVRRETIEDRYPLAGGCGGA